MPGAEIKQEVREFYDRVGWQPVGEGLYQNTRYEDLRPVSREYIHRCHLRVNRHLAPNGEYLLDGGSGPVQYPEYLTYSDGYQYRVCVDLSIIALQEARKRLGQHGLFVVADVANLPFCSDVFGGAVSLHTFHHLPLDEQKKAYYELQRVLAPGKSAVIVNGWTQSRLMSRLQWLVGGMERLTGVFAGRKKARSENGNNKKESASVQAQPTGTFVEKFDSAWLQRELADLRLEVFVWRSVSVRFLRAVIHPGFAGKLWLRLLYWLEEHSPAYFGENGQYPLIVMSKPAKAASEAAGMVE